MKKARTVWIGRGESGDFTICFVKPFLRTDRGVGECWATELGDGGFQHIRVCGGSLLKIIPGLAFMPQGALVRVSLYPQFEFVGKTRGWAVVK